MAGATNSAAEAGARSWWGARGDATPARCFAAHLRCGAWSGAARAAARRAPARRAPARLRNESAVQLLSTRSYDDAADDARRRSTDHAGMHCMAARAVTRRAAASALRRRPAAERRHVRKAEDAAQPNRSLRGGAQRAASGAARWERGHHAATSASHLRCGGAGVAHAHHGAGPAAIKQPSAHRRRKLRQRDAQCACSGSRRTSGSGGKAVVFACALGHVDDQRRRGRSHHGGQLRRCHLSAQRRGGSGCALQLRRRLTTRRPEGARRRGAPEALRRRVGGAQRAGRVGRRIRGVCRRRGCEPGRR